MKKTLLAMALVGVSSISVAGDLPHEFSANVAMTTDYVFRGLSQTSEDPAIQGGFDYSYSRFGFYAGVWASSLDFGVADPDDADIEVDFYGGFGGKFAIGNGLGWDIGGLYYLYPGSDTGSGVADYDYVEVYGSLSYDFGPLSASVGAAYSPDYFFESDDGLYVNVDVDVPLPYGLNLAGHVGHQDIDDNAQFGTPDYTDWKIGISKDIGMFTFDVSYYDTDLDTAECFGGGDVCDGRAVFTVSSAW